MKVLLTGAAGFIGSHTTEALVSRGHHVVGVDSFDSYLYAESVKRDNAAVLMSAVDSTKFDLFEGNICKADEIERLMRDEKIEVVCHLAALAGVRPSLAEPMRYIETNHRGTAVILEACRNVGVKQLVFASSSSVYVGSVEAC